MTKKLVRLTEGDLHRIIKESVNNVLNEISNDLRYNYIKGRANQRAIANQKQKDAWLKDGHGKLAYSSQQERDAVDANWNDKHSKEWSDANNEYWKRDAQIRDAARHPGYDEWYKQNKMYKK